MYCARCGSPLAADAAFCGSCGAQIASPGTDAPRELSRPGIVTLLAVLQFIGAAVSLLAAVVMLAATALSYGKDEGQPLGVLLAILFGGLGAAELVCGIGLLKLKSYGRTLQLVFSWVGLLGFPIGTVISLLILIYLNKPGLKVLFSGRPASQLTPDDWAQVAAVGSSRAAPWLIGAIVVLVLVVPILGIVAAIAIPGLVRARMSGNEASAIGSLRAINSAQAAFSVSCAKGLYAVTLEDLVKPPRGDRQGFISDDLGINGVTKSGYVISVAKDAAPGVTDAGAAASTCNGSTRPLANSYFASAAPVTLHSTGTRYFATDARGTIFSSRFPIANPITESPTVVRIE
jgi:type IV pilus assembly protein PilA